MILTSADQIELERAYLEIQLCENNLSPNQILKTSERESFRSWRKSINDTKTKTRIRKGVYGLRRGQGNIKNLKQELIELKLVGNPPIRIYFTVNPGKVIVLLFGGTKRNQNHDIEMARKLLEENNRRRRTNKETKVNIKEDKLIAEKSTPNDVKYLEYTEFEEITELEDEEDRYLFLYYMVNDKDTRKETWLHEQAKETVRKSREYYKHPVPDPEFFGF